MKLVHTLALAVITTAAATAQSTQSAATLRVCTYNVLNYGDNDADRNVALRTVVGAVHPDLLVTQRINGDVGARNFLDSVVRPTLGPTFVSRFTNGPDTDNALYYDSTRVRLIASTAMTTELRNIDLWTVTVQATGDTVQIFGVHLKAGDTPDDAAQRQTDAWKIRDMSAGIPATRHYLLVGTVNAYTSGEQAYQTLTGQTQLPGAFVDPIGSPGDWHSNPAFAALHTQSPRRRAFGGGTGGGLNDRFDFILTSPSLVDPLRGDRAIVESYRALGNDGAHFGDSLNRLPNTAVTPEVAQALHDAADHLPVYLDIELAADGTAGVHEARGSASSPSVEPLPAADRVRIRLGAPAMSDAVVRLVDHVGRELLRSEVAAGASLVDLDVAALAAGVYIAEVRVGSDVRTTPVVIAR